MDMIVIQPYILVLKLKKTKTKFLLCTGYLNSIKNIKQDLLLALVIERQQNFVNCTTVKSMSSSTVKRYMRDLVKTYFGLLRIQVKF